MSIADAVREFLSLVSGHPLLERLFFASGEFAVLAGVVWVVIRVARIQSARLIALLWIVVLAKPIVSLVIGSPLHILQVEIVRSEDAVGAEEAVEGQPSLVLPTETVTSRPGNEWSGASRRQESDEVVPGRADARLLRPSPQSDLAMDPASTVAVEAPTTSPVVERAPASPRWNAATMAIALWLTGVTWFAFRSALGRLTLRRLIRRASPPAAELSAHYGRLATQFGVRRPPRLKVTDELESPALVGSLTPTILVPRWLARKANAEKVDWALRHELMHWKLFDPLAGLVREIAEALFYFHPVAWWAGRNWEVAAELACDRAIVTDHGDSQDYAAQLYGMLVEIRGRRRIPVKSGLFATRTQITQRIAALVRGPLTTKAHLSALAIVAVAAVSVAALSVGGTFAEKPTEAELTVGADEAAVGPRENEGKKAAASPTAGESGASKAPMEGDTVTVTGVVLTPEGKPAAGATVRAAAPLWAMMKPIVGDNFQSPMSETTSDANGRFAISFPTRPFGDVSRLDEFWRQIWKKTTVAASLKGFGPAWVAYDDVPAGQSATLRLVEDLPIRGRVIDLEGRPVGGTVVKIGEPQASKDEDLSDWIEGVKAGQLPWIVYSTAPRSVESRLVSTPMTVTTDLDGRFEIRGLGRERFVSLTFEGETVAHRGITAVTRSMEPFQRVISPPPFAASEPVLGAELTFTADPARTIEGVVRDAKTGEVLAGVSVESDKLVGYPYSNHRVLKTKTDQAGRFRLVGMPKGKGNRLLLLPNDDQPYFMRQVDVPDPVGLGPAQMDIGLHRGIWITGRVTDKSTGEPVRAVRMHYLPFRSNEYVQKAPEFDADGNVDGDQLRYQTKVDGTYRLVGLPGRAIVGADSVMTDFRRGVGYDEIDAPKDSSAINFDTYRNPVNPGPKWPTMMREINPTADDKMVSLDFQLDPGQSVRIRVRGTQGEPLVGVSVVGSSWSHRTATDNSVLMATNFGPNETRMLLFHRKDLNVGRVLSIGPDEIRSGEVTVELQTCATIVGRILNEDGGPVSGMSIQPNVLPNGDFSQRLPSAPTDVHGRFRVTLLPGCQYHLAGEGGGFQFVTIARDISIEPGETRDLGTVTLGKDGKIISKRMEVEPKNPHAAETLKAAEAPESTAAASREVEFSGNVVDLNGKPVEGATIWLVSPSPDNSNPALRGTVRKVASSDRQGRFSFGVEPGSGYPLDTPAWMEYEAKILARSPGNGFDWLPLAVFERNPTPTKRRDEIRQRTDDRLGAGRFDSQTLKLPPEVGPVQGRLVDLEGRPLANVTVLLDSIQNLDFAMLTEAFEKSSRDLADRSVNSRSAPGGWISRHEWQTLIPPVKTDANGEFSLSGLGRDQMATVTFSGERVDAERLCILGREMETKRLPHISFYPNGHKDVFVGTRFTHAVGPAIPVSGIVTEFKSGKPIAGATVFVERLFREGRASTGQLRLHTHHICSVTDEQGRYRLIGIPPGEGHVLNVITPKSEPWLMASQEVALDSSQSDAKVNIQVFRGIWIEGRVTDGATGQPVPGWVDYLALRTNPNIPQKFGIQDTWEMLRFPIAESGRYRVPGLPGPGVLLVRSSGKTVYPLSVGAEKVDGYDPKYPFLPTTPRSMPLSNFNQIQQIEPPVDAESHAIDLTLSAGLSLIGRVVGPDSAPVPRFGVLGTLAGDPFFKEIKGDKFTIHNYEHEEARDLFFKSADNSLVGHLRIEGAKPADLMVTLQPAVTARGRLIETETDEEAVGYIVYCNSTKQGNFRVDDDITTDEHGRFEIRGLLAGNVYKMDSANVQRFNNQKNGFTIDLTNASPGDIVELGDVTGSKAKSKVK